LHGKAGRRRLTGAGRREGALLPNETIKAHTSADNGAQIGPTEAIPSVANSEPFMLPMS
jgi:hypothetical protein